MGAQFYVDATIAESPESAGQTTADPRSRIAPRKIIKWAIAMVVLGVVAAISWHYWRHSQLFVSTDNAYLNANMVEIAPQVAGPILRIHVRDQQSVQAGDPLFEIDPRPYEIALAEAQAQLELARQSNSQDSAAVAAARAQVAQRVAELRIARSNDKRTRDLIAKGFLSQQNAEATQTQAETAAAVVKAAEANLAAAQSALGETGSKNAAVQVAQARVDQARLDLGFTRVVAPTSGVIANFSLRPGSTVQKGVPIFAIIDDQEYWVDANFKETELNRVRPGQRATIVMDMYKKHPFTAEVESLSGGSGTAFSLLPAQNATGNWVKVTQRVPVRIRVLDPDPAFPLRIGTTASVEVRAD